MAKRRFSLEEDFMKWNSNDLLYAFMRTLSTARPVNEDEKEFGSQKYKEYLPIKTFNKHKKTIAGICGCTTKTINRNLDRLGEKGLLDEGVEIIKAIDKNNEEVKYVYDVFWFPQTGTEYKLIDKEMLSYLIDTRNAHTIRIYLYLLNKYEWKLNEGLPNYIFTNAELKEALGYNRESAVGTQNIVDSLAREGIIKYQKRKDEIDNVKGCTHTERMELLFVATSVEQLKKVG